MKLSFVTTFSILLLSLSASTVEAQFTPASPTVESLSKRADCRYRFRVELTPGSVDFINVDNFLNSGNSFIELSGRPSSFIMVELLRALNIKPKSDDAQFSGEIILSIFNNGYLALYIRNEDGFHTPGGAMAGVSLEHECPVSPKKKR